MNKQRLMARRNIKNEVAGDRKKLDEEMVSPDHEDETYKYTSEFEKGLRDFSGINLVIATIIATATFAAAFTMPGGYNDKGLPVFDGSKEFKRFLYYDKLAFVFSAASLFIHYFIPVFEIFAATIWPVFFTTYLTALSLCSMVYAFGHGIETVLSSAAKRDHFGLNEYYLPPNTTTILFFCCVIFFVIYFLLLILNYKIFKKIEPRNNVRSRFRLRS